MDKKELLRRWTLGYVEPSLFYLPQKKPTPMCTVRLQFMETFYAYGMWESTAYLTNRAETIIGAIFSIDNKFVSYVTPNYTNVTFLTTLKKGKYVFKEAVSPKGCLLAEDTVFSVDNTYQTIQIKHKRNGFVIKLTREESEDHNTDFREIIDNDNVDIDILKSEMTIGKRHNIFINYLSLYDNSIIRKIEDAWFFNDYFGGFSSGSGVPLPYENNENKLTLLHKQNQYAERTYIYQYLEERKYKYDSELYRHTVANLLFYNDKTASSCKVWWRRDINTENLLLYDWKCDYPNGIIRVGDYVTGRLYVNDVELSEHEDFLVNLTEEKLKQIYEFAIKNCKPKYFHNSTSGDGVSYSVYVSDGNYYPERNESTGYDGFFISVGKITTTWDISQSIIFIPVKLLLSDSKNVSQNELFDTKILVSNGKDFNYNYRRFFITDYKTDTSPYFHGVNPNMTNTEMFNDPLITIYDDGYNDYGIQVFTQEFTNEKLLAEINSYIKDGD